MIKDRPKTSGTLSLDKIRIDGGTQMRADLNEDVVAEYAQIVRDGGDFEPVVVFFDGSKHWLGDGFHRHFAYQRAGAAEIPADIRPGTKRDAILFSVGANAMHGLRRTNADKRKAVETLLKDKEWSAWPQAKIAQACGVSREFVNRLSQAASCDRSQDGGRTVERNGSTYQQNTANIGKGKSPDASALAEADATEATSEGGIDAVPATDAKAEKDAKRAAIDQWHAQHKAAVPEHIRQAQAATEAAIAKRRETADAADDDGLTDEQRIAELREHIKVVEAENETLKAEVAKFAPMRVQFEQGGFEKVIAGKDEEIRVLRSSLEVESADKATLAGQVRFWKKEAKARGWKPDVVKIDTKTGALKDA